MMGRWDSSPSSHSRVPLSQGTCSALGTALRQAQHLFPSCLTYSHRFIGLHDLRRALFDSVMRHHRAGRHDLVQALSWSFICA